MDNLKDILKEENLRICKVCNKLKKRSFDGKYNAKDKRWVDDEGLLWAGNICGSCNRDRAKETMRKKRARRNVD